MTVRTLTFAAFTALLVGSSGCRRNSNAVDEMAAATPEEARERFLKAVAEKDLSSMASQWPTYRGSIAIGT